MRTRTKGFSLIETSIVLVIFGMLMTPLLSLLISTTKQAQYTNTKTALVNIQNALIGYVQANGFLPCATHTTNPASPLYGMPDALVGGACPILAARGYLPWALLGVPPMDSWGSTRASIAGPWPGYWRYRVDATFSTPCATPPCTALVAPSKSTITLSVVAGTGDNLVVVTGPLLISPLVAAAGTPAAIIYSAGPNVTDDGLNAVYGPTYQSTTPSTVPVYDDITVVISKATIGAMMAQVGNLHP